MNKMKMESKDIIGSNIEKLKELFPSCVQEEKIDFDMLKQELSSVVIDDKKEKYQLTWPGKKEAIVLSNERINKTLRPIKEKSVDFDKTENIYLEGDNLDVLKILQESYLNKIKCIYIDPPYNTGNDFVYNDKFAKKEIDELIANGRMDKEGNILISKDINNFSNGKFHSNWLSMIYSRLKLGRNLLRNDGIIFISIDDCELANLKKICDEIYGETNFISQIVIETGEVFGVKAAHVSKTFVKVKDYVLVYAKNINMISDFMPLKDSMRELYDKHFSTIIDNNYNTMSLIDYLKIQNQVVKMFKAYNLNINKDSINILMNLDKNFRDFMYNEISNILYTDAPLTKKIPTNLAEKLPIGKPFNYEDKLCFKTSTGSIRMFIKFKDSLCMSDDYEPKYTRTSFRGDLWKNFHIDMRNIGKEGETEFPNGKKPVRLIQQLLKWVNDKNAIVLDFFSGSATTAHATILQNSMDNGNRKFILVQLPEKLNNSIQSTICDLGEERIRKAAKKIKDETNANIDYGFRVYKVDSSNMKDVYYKPSELGQTNLFDMMSNIKEDRTPEDLLTQVMLDLGLTLDLKIEEKTILNNKVYYVADNALVACFDDNIDINIIDEICKCKPLKVVFKDMSFKSDKDKINLEERVKKLSPDTEISIL